MSDEVLSLAEKSSEKDNYRSLLEWELGLDSSDIRSHGWYHGNISRLTAESFVKDKEGSFLVRDCSSKPEEYVLTCFWNDECLHFVINRQVLPPYQFGFPDRIQYSFEDEAFDTVSDLITFSVGNRRPISFSSGAIISKPINRENPLTLCHVSNEESYSQKQQSIDSENQLCDKFSTVIRSESRSSIDSSGSRYKKIINQIGSQGTIGSANIPSMLTPTISGKTYAGQKQAPCYSQLIKSKYNLEPLTASIISSSSSTSNSIAQLSQSAAITTKPEPIYANAEVYQEFLKKRESEDFAYFSDYSDKESKSGSGRQDDYASYIISSNYSLSRIDPITFHTYLLPKNNKPLDGSAINKMRNTILDTGARLLANHVTQADLEFIYHAGSPIDLGFGVESGLELLLLPQGAKYRSDFLDRVQSFQYFIETSVLTCQSEKERAAVIDKWIQIAVECKTGLGNLMTFAVIITALSSPLVIRLRRTWLVLRQLYTDSAVTFESKLRPIFKSMNECREPFAPNTTFPFILPSVKIIDRHYSIRSDEINQEDISSHLKNVSLDLDLEKIGSDYGLETISSHLDHCRQIVSQCSLFKRNGKILLQDVDLEDLLVDMFRTEFHRRFLWGTKGSNVEASQRYDKFNQLLNILSQKCELD